MLFTRRLLVTLLIPALFLAAQQWLLLPGLDHAHLKALLARGANGDLSTFSVLSIGISPALTAFIIVEWAALLVPPWRALRRGTPAQRQSLERAALIGTFLVAIAQSWFGAVSVTTLRGTAPLFPDTTLARLVITVSLVAGTGVVLVLASVIDRFGLGRGFSILLVTPIVVTAVRLAKVVPLLPSGDLVWLAAEVAAVVAAARFVLTAHRRAATTSARLRLPTSGLVPLSVATAGLALVSKYLITVPDSGTVVHAGISTLVIIAVAVVVTRLYFPTAKLRDVWRRADPSLATDDFALTLRAALIKTVVFLLVVGIGFSLLAHSLHLAAVIDPLLVVATTAVVLDLVAEARARRAHGELVAVWSLHQLALLDAATTALERAAIPVHARAAHHRALLWFFGPYIPVELMVPPARAAEARDLLATVLLDPPFVR